MNAPGATVYLHLRDTNGPSAREGRRYTRVGVTTAILGSEWLLQYDTADIRGHQRGDNPYPGHCRLTLEKRRQRRYVRRLGWSDIGERPARDCNRNPGYAAADASSNPRRPAQAHQAPAHGAARVRPIAMTCSILP